MLVGRDAELERLDRVLAAGKSALTLVTGPPNIGKSTLLRELRKRAEKRHYRIVPDSTDGDSTVAGIVIDKATKNEQLYEAMRISQTSTPLDWPNASNVRLVGSTVSHAREDLDQSLDSRDSDDHTSTDSTNTDVIPQRPVMSYPPDPQHESELKGDITNPTLVLIDGYRPDKQLEDWFIDSIIPTLRDSTPVRVIVIAGFASGVSRLTPYAKEVVVLEPPDEDIVATHLQQINVSLRNRMSEAEIQHYAKELSADPSLINSLERLLKLDA